MTRAEIIVLLRKTAHALEMGCFGHGGEDPFPELVELLDQAADELKIAWIERETLLAAMALLSREPSEEQKKAMLASFDKEAGIS